jgi:zinc transport system substrate-binding protein
MQTAVTRVADALAALDPEGAPGYRERARSVSRELEALDAEIRRRAAGWPDRAVVAEHAFLGPFAERYGLRVAAVLEPVHGREPTPKRLSRILEAIPSEGVAAILVPAGEGGAAARVAAEETGLPLRELVILGGAPGDRYESVLLACVDALVEALG